MDLLDLGTIEAAARRLQTHSPNLHERKGVIASSELLLSGSVVLRQFRTAHSSPVTQEMHA
jgi:hypothetical protein